MALDLDLLKKELTDTLQADEPDAEAGGIRFIADFLRHYVRGRAITMLPRARLDHLQGCIEHVLREGIPGDLLEAGVWRGGSVIFMRAVLASRGVDDRIVWAADSFQGLPQPDPVRFPKEAAIRQGPVMRDAYDGMSASLEAVKANFARYGLLDEQVRFLAGWFRDTLPAAPVERLAILRLDADFNESTTDVLANLYAKVVDGGFVIVDDYGEDDWTDCRAAVDGFREQHGIREPLERVDRRCWYWRRTA